MKNNSTYINSYFFIFIDEETVSSVLEGLAEVLQGLSGSSPSHSVSRK